MGAWSYISEQDKFSDICTKPSNEIESNRGGVHVVGVDILVKVIRGHFPVEEAFEQRLDGSK